MIEFGSGIRILKANPLEMIFSFTISQNNNIKRIKQIVERLCELSNSHTTPKHFPTIEELASAPLSFYSSLGAGYRDKFLKEISTTLLNVNLNEISKLDTDNLYNFLLSLKGVGPKVASCILLFGFGRSEKFPVDTWLEQVYYNHFSKQKRTRPEIQKYFEDQFGEYSGIAQQYLFYYERSKNSIKK
jgi:N-glycosylase/DNA lyase